MSTGYQIRDQNGGLYFFFRLKIGPVFFHGMFIGIIVLICKLCGKLQDGGFG